MGLAALGAAEIRSAGSGKCPGLSDGPDGGRTWTERREAPGGTVGTEVSELGFRQ